MKKVFAVILAVVVLIGIGFAGEPTKPNSSRFEIRSASTGSYFNRAMTWAENDSTVFMLPLYPFHPDSAFQWTNVIWRYPHTLVQVDVTAPAADTVHFWVKVRAGTADRVSGTLDTADSTSTAGFTVIDSFLVTSAGRTFHQVQETSNTLLPNLQFLIQSDSLNSDSTFIRIRTIRSK